MTTIEPKSGRKGSSYDAFEYIAHSHTYMSDNQPTAKFTYDLSPIQVSKAVCSQELQQVATPALSGKHTGDTVFVRLSTCPAGSCRTHSQCRWSVCAPLLLWSSIDALPSWMARMRCLHAEIKSRIAGWAAGHSLPCKQGQAA